MEPVVIARGGDHRSAWRASAGGGRRCSLHRIVGLAAVAMSLGLAMPAPAQDRAASAPGSGRGPSALTVSRETTTPPTTISRPGPPAPATAPATTSAATTAAVRRFRIRDDAGKCVVARLHGQYGDKAVLMQPDGQLGFPTMLVPTTDRFEPVSAEALRTRLSEGPFSGFAVLTTAHYLIFYKSRLAFAQDSARLLEDLYRGLIEFCHRHDIPVHEAEFPLVAVIFANERDFRAHKPVDPEVQAYYEVFPNRIFFYEESEKDRNEPRLVRFRKPQTVAHEGTHQILANIGVQPRLSAWPLWLIEGFAEYCATPTRTKKGLAFDRLGTINALHMATLRELDDPLSQTRPDPEARAGGPPRPARLMDSDALLTKTRLTPTDYAQAWALTHYLTQRSPREFVRYLRAMSLMPPLEPRTPDENLAEFRKYFGDDLARLDKKVEDYIRKLSQRGNFPVLPYFAVIFEQPLGGGMIRRKAWVSQSPQMIQRLIEQTVSPQGGVYNWEAYPYPTRARAELAAETWIRGY